MTMHFLKNINICKNMFISHVHSRILNHINKVTTMYFINMIYNYFFLGNLLITGLFNSFDKSIIAKSFPNPSVFLLLIIFLTK